jgi:hypothetical protein
MLRRTIVFLFIASLAAVSCKESGGDATGDGGAKAPKLICKMNNQCWICPSDDAMKKCIINPVTSGCKQSTESECR